MTWLLISAVLSNADKDTYHASHELGEFSTSMLRPFRVSTPFMATDTLSCPNPRTSPLNYVELLRVNKVCYNTTRQTSVVRRTAAIQSSFHMKQATPSLRVMGRRSPKDRFEAGAGVMSLSSCLSMGRYSNGVHD